MLSTRQIGAFPNHLCPVAHNRREHAEYNSAAERGAVDELLRFWGMNRERDDKPIMEREGAALAD